MPPAGRTRNAEGLLGIFNVWDRGATGDGQHDDSGGIQAAILAAGAAGGGLVAIPAGTYRLGSNVVWGNAANVTIWQHSGATFTGPGTLPAAAGSNAIRAEPSGATIGGVPTTSAVGDVAAAGATGIAADAGHLHGREVFGGAPTTQAFGDAAAAGAAATPAHSDHRHGMPGDQSVGSRQVNLTKATADVAALETTTSTAFVDLTTVGPAVTLTPGIAMTHLIVLSCGLWNGAGDAIAGVSIAGVAPAATDVVDSAAPNTTTGARQVLAPNVASGSTHTMKYRATSGTASFNNRRLTAVAL